MLTLLNQYKTARKGLSQMITALPDIDGTDDKKLLNSMRREVNIIIEWLEKGFDPENPKGINKHNAYHVSYLSNMDILPDIAEQVERKPLIMTDEQKRIIRHLLEIWTDRERDCFILHIAKDKSMTEIADELGLTKASVQTYIGRAKQKVDIAKGRASQLELI